MQMLHSICVELKSMHRAVYSTYFKTSFFHCKRQGVRLIMEKGSTQPALPYDYTSI